MGVRKHVLLRAAQCRVCTADLELANHSQRRLALPAVARAPEVEDCGCMFLLSLTATCQL